MQTNTEPVFGSPFRNLKTRTKLFINMGIVCTLMLVTGIVGIWGMHQITDRAAVITSQNLTDMTGIAAVHTAIDNLDRDFRQALIETDQVYIQKAHALEATDEQQLNTVVAQYQAAPHSSAEAANVATFNASLSSWVDTLHTLEKFAGFSHFALDNAPRNTSATITPLRRSA